MQGHQGGEREKGNELQAGPLSLALPTVWLVFLVLPLVEAWGDRGTLQWSLGVVATVTFALVYTWTFELSRRARARRRSDLEVGVAWRWVAALLACMVGMLYGLGQIVDGSLIFTCVVLAMILPGLQAAVAVPVMAALMLGASLVIPGWGPNPNILLTAVAAGFVMWGVKQLLTVNLNLITMRDVQRELAREQERTRLSRDLHDILGQSLTVVAVKAELADRLLELDPSRAHQELTEIQSLSRDALDDIRKAVNGYREPSLSAELARARQALEAARINATVPFTVDEVRGPAREMFAWAVREGVTNVLRHARAHHCRIDVTPTRLVVTDDGFGPPVPDGEGNGLRGLIERANDVGAIVSARNLEPHGFELVVEMGP